MIRPLLALLLLALAGCTHPARAPDGSVAPPRSPPATPSPAAGAGAAPSTDFKPYLAFRDHAAKALGVRPDELDGGAIDAATAATMPHSIRGAWAYTMTLKSDPAREARGWVTADGAVITPDHNLGRLFEEAGVWGKTPAATASQLAEMIAWSYGMNNRVVIEPENGFPAPALALGADGAGRFRFTLGWRAPGPGGAGGGPEDRYRIDVALAASHEATLTRTPAKGP